jgi:hypothetical protein
MPFTLSRSLLSRPPGRDDIAKQFDRHANHCWRQGWGHGHLRQPPRLSSPGAPGQPRVLAKYTTCTHSAPSAHGFALRPIHGSSNASMVDFRRWGLISCQLAHASARTSNEELACELMRELAHPWRFATMHSQVKGDRNEDSEKQVSTLVWVVWTQANTTSTCLSMSTEVSRFVSNCDEKKQQFGMCIGKCKLRKC